MKIHYVFWTIAAIVFVSLAWRYFLGGNRRGNPRDRKTKKDLAQAPMRDIAAICAAYGQPAAHAIATQAPSNSYFGGSPKLPKGVAWPEKQGQKLTFLANISLKGVQMQCAVDWLPKGGDLLFFYDTENQPWGFDPKDRGGCAVIYVAEPRGTDVDTSSLADTADERCPKTNIAFRPIRSLPATDRDRIGALNLSDEEAEVYWQEMERVHGDAPKHHVAGYPSPVQGDGMELECQLASNGLNYGDGSGYEDPKFQQLAVGASDWRLLFQFDSDDDLGVMWGDCGTLYFWVRAEEAAAGKFENVWVILQCS